MQRPKMTKSWSLTVVMFILVTLLPFANDHLSAYGIVITEEELNHFLYALFGVGAIGGGLSINKKLQDRKKEEKVIQSHTPAPASMANIEPTVKKPSVQHAVDDVNWSGTGWYQTNFRKDNERGNSLNFGDSFLWVKIPSAELYVAGGIYKDGLPLAIGQSSRSDEDGDISTIRFNLFKPNGEPLPRGRYILQITVDGGWENARSIRDEFEIV